MNLSEKLEKIKSRYDQINSQLSDPAYMNDIEKLKNRNKERSNLEELITTYNKYTSVIKNIAGNEEIISSVKETDMIELAEAELEELKIQKENLEEQIKL